MLNAEPSWVFWVLHHWSGGAACAAASLPNLPSEAQLEKTAAVCSVVSNIRAGCVCLQQRVLVCVQSFISKGREEWQGVYHNMLCFYV